MSIVCLQLQHQPTSQILNLCWKFSSTHLGNSPTCLGNSLTVLGIPPPVLGIPPPVLGIPPPVLGIPPPVLGIPPPVLGILSRPVLNQSFLGDLGVGVWSSVKTGVLRSGDRASQRLGRPTECLGMRLGSVVEDRDLIREDKGKSQTERRWVSILFNIRTN